MKVHHSENQYNRHIRVLRMVLPKTMATQPVTELLAQEHNLTKADTQSTILVLSMKITNL